MVEKQEFKELLRIADRDVKGNTAVLYAIARAKGVGLMFSNAVCSVLKLNRSQKVGTLSDKELEQIETCLRDPKKFTIPAWLFNRQRDIDSGTDEHRVSSDLDLTHKFDIRRLKKIRSYRGWRHQRGMQGLKLKVRGQRTRSTGRKGKAVGVVRKKK